MDNALADLMRINPSQDRRNRLADLLRNQQMSHQGTGYIPSQREIQTAIQVGQGSLPNDVAYGEQPLEAPAVAGGLLSLDPTDYISGAGLAKTVALLKGGALGLGALGAGMGVMSKLGAESVPSRFKQSGQILSSGLLKKGERAPEGVSTIAGLTDKLPQSSRYDAFGNIFDDMYAQVKPMQDGNFLATYIAPWGSKSKNAYATGDNPEELANFILNKKNRSDAAIARSEKQKYDNSLIGKLSNEFGDIFDTAKSARSESQYITHKPSGTKIRISGHALPLGYESPDLNIPIGISDDEKFQLIKNYLSGDQ